MRILSYISTAFIALCLYVSIYGATDMQWQSLIDDIDHGRLYIVQRIIPNQVDIADTYQGLIPLDIARSSLKKARHHHVKKNIERIVVYLENQQCKRNAQKVVYHQVITQEKPLGWKALAIDIRQGNLSGVAFLVPKHIKITDVSHEGLTPLDIARNELRQKHRLINKRRIQEIIAYLESIAQQVHPKTIMQQETISRKNERNTGIASENKKIKKLKKATRTKPYALTIIAFYDNNKPYYELSNFYPVVGGISIDDVEWPTVEHYYQVNRFKDKGLQAKICATSSAYTAFTIAQQNKELEDPEWHTIPYVAAENNISYLPLNEQVMLKGLRAKFAHDPFKRLLLDTGDAYLVYYSPTDMFWGWHPGTPDNKTEVPGVNMLGKMLMHVRNELRKGSLLQFDQDAHNPWSYNGIINY